MSPKIFGYQTTLFGYVPEYSYILLFLSLFAHKRPSLFFYTYPTKKPSFKPINTQFVVAGVC